MRLYKIKALMYSDFMLIRNTKWKLFEFIYFPLTTILIWGLFSIYIKGYALQAGVIVLAVNILWNFAQVAQSHADMQINEDSWSGSLKQIIISGVSDFEYIASRVFSGAILSFAILALMLLMSLTFFDFSVVFNNPAAFSVIIVSTLIASMGLSIITAGAMIALGKEYGFLAWTILQVFILLSAPFYPVSVFPEFMRPIVSAMPFTNVFEATRNIIQNNLNWSVVMNSVYVSVAYFIISLPFYRYIFKKARERGWLVRLS